MVPFNKDMFVKQVKLYMLSYGKHARVRFVLCLLLFWVLARWHLGQTCSMSQVTERAKHQIQGQPMVMQNSKQQEPSLVTSRQRRTIDSLRIRTKESGNAVLPTISSWVCENTP